MTRAIWWIRRDLRLDDNPALAAALEHGAVVPVYIHAPAEEQPWAAGAASRAWLRQSLRRLDAELRRRGSALIIRSGPSAEALLQLARETAAVSVHGTRVYEPQAIARDRAVKHMLRDAGLDAHSHGDALLLEPWQVATATGAPYRVFTPFWRNLRARLPERIEGWRAPAQLPGVPNLESVPLDSCLPAPRPAWDRRFWSHWQPGEAGAQELLEAFIEGAAARYGSQRDLPDRAGTSRLSPHLHFGEISPRQVLARLRSEPWPAGAAAGVEAYVRELAWREFSHHLLFHFPASAEHDLNPRFERFPWSPADEHAIDAWRRGRTGVPLVDAGMRELWQTGWMHNRVRMVVASFLCKNLRQHWRVGAHWFWDTLLDADLANNTQGWQWSAGTGADAAPYFRIFNPVSQARRFDPQGRYVRRWLPELASLPDAALFEPWNHPELLRRHAPGYPDQPIVDLKSSRAAALAAYSASNR